jgi:hypothetical protein
VGVRFGLLLCKDVSLEERVIKLEVDDAVELESELSGVTGGVVNNVSADPLFLSFLGSTFQCSMTPWVANICKNIRDSLLSELTLPLFSDGSISERSCLIVEEVNDCFNIASCFLSFDILSLPPITSVNLAL